MYLDLGRAVEQGLGVRLITQGAAIFDQRRPHSSPERKSVAQPHAPSGHGALERGQIDRTLAHRTFGLELRQYDLRTRMRAEGEFFEIFYPELLEPAQVDSGDQSEAPAPRFGADRWPRVQRDSPVFGSAAPRAFHPREPALSVFSARAMPFRMPASRRMSASSPILRWMKSTAEAASA